MTGSNETRSKQLGKIVEPRARVIKAFASLREWRVWLARHHARANGVWLRFFKKESGVRSLTYAEALDEALCWGWIDGQADKYDDESWLQRFSPRRTKSLWSKRNRERVARLAREKRMKPSGLKEIEAAKEDGRWDRAYDSPKSMKIPADFRKALKGYTAAEEFFKTLNKANLYSIAWRLQTAKRPETRNRRMQAIIAMLRRGEKFH